MSQQGLPDTATEGDLRVRYAPIDVLIPYVNNSRTHSDAQIAQVAASIKEFGFSSPILVDGERGIIAGHARLAAARKLGMDKVPVIELAHLTDAQRKAYIIADNKLTLNGGWDNELLALEFTALTDQGFDLSLLGFDTGEIDVLLNGWAPDMGKIDKTPAELSDLMATVKVKCPQDMAQTVSDAVKEMIAEAGWDGVTVE